MAGPQKSVPLVRKAHMGGVALEEAHAQVGFERADLFGERRLRHVRRFGRLVKIERLRYAHKAFEPPVVYLADLLVAGPCDRASQLGPSTRPLPKVYGRAGAPCGKFRRGVM